MASATTLSNGRNSAVSRAWLRLGRVLSNRAAVTAIFFNDIMVSLTRGNRVLNPIQCQRRKISEVLTPPKAKLLFITYSLLIDLNSLRR
ncbi:hypothetical protein D3C78_1776990 [compost metagenome]